MLFTANYPVATVGIPPRKSEERLCVVNREVEFDIPSYSGEAAPKVMDIIGHDSVAGDVGGAMAVRHVDGRLYREAMSLDAFRTSLTTPFGRPPHGFTYRNAIYKLHTPMWQRAKEVIELNYETGGPRLWPTDIDVVFERDGRINKTLTRVAKPLQAFHRYPGAIPHSVAENEFAQDDAIFADIISNYAVIEGKVYVSTAEPFYTVSHNHIDLAFPDNLFESALFPYKYADQLFFEINERRDAVEFIRMTTSLTANGAGNLPRVETYETDYQFKYDGVSLSALMLARQFLLIADKQGLSRADRSVELIRLDALVSAVTPRNSLPSEIKDIVINIAEDITKNTRGRTSLGFVFPTHSLDFIKNFIEYADRDPVDLGLKASSPLAEIK
jgi:hypothetical protein